MYENIEVFPIISLKSRSVIKNYVKVLWIMLNYVLWIMLKYLSFGWFVTIMGIVHVYSCNITYAKVSFKAIS